MLPRHTIVHRHERTTGHAGELPAELVVCVQISDDKTAAVEVATVARLGVDFRLTAVCAVQRRRFPAGASPARQGLQPEATGAGMEVRKCLKPSDSASRFGDAREE